MTYLVVTVYQVLFWVIFFVNYHTVLDKVTESIRRSASSRSLILEPMPLNTSLSITLFTGWPALPPLQPPPSLLSLIKVDLPVHQHIQGLVTLNIPKKPLHSSVKNFFKLSLNLSPWTLPQLVSEPPMSYWKISVFLIHDIFSNIWTRLYCPLSIFWFHSLKQIHFSKPSSEFRFSLKTYPSISHYCRKS